MALIIDGLRVSNTNWSNDRKGRVTRNAVRIYLGDVKVAEVFPTKVNPLNYLRIHPTSKYTISLIDQLRKANIKDETISKIVFQELT